MRQEKSTIILLNCNFKIYLLKILFLLTFMTACEQMTKTPIQRWQHAAQGAYAAEISEDGQYSVVSSVLHGMSFWDLNTNSLKYRWAQQQNSADNLVLVVDIANNNSHVVSASRHNFSLWNAESGQAEGYWAISEATIRDVAVANNGRYVLLGQSNNKAVHIDIDTGRRLEFLAHSEKINVVDMLPNGRIAMTGGNDFVAYIWDTESGQIIYRFNHPSRVTMVALDPQGRYAFSADSKKAANIWDLKTGKLISKLHYVNRQEIFNSVRFSPDGTKLLTGAPSRKVSIWSIATGERLSSWRVSVKDTGRPTSAVVHSVAFKGNEQVLTESSSGYAELWKIK